MISSRTTRGRSNPPLPTDSPPDRTAARDRARARILRAAQAVFSDRGFAAASISRIAARAGYSKGLIHHYFGTKHDLWRAAVDALAHDAAEHAVSGPPTENSLSEIEALTGRMFEFFRDNPNWLRLESWAELESETPLPGAMLSLERDVDSRFEAAQRSGAIRRDIDPLHARVLAHVAAVGWLRTKRLLCPAWGRDADADGTDEAFLEDLFRILRAGLSPAAAPDGGGRPTAKKV